MRLGGRRESSNVEDRRGMSKGKASGLGIGGIVVVALITWLMGGNPLDVLTSSDLTGMITNSSDANYQPSAEEEELAKFASQVLAGTEDIWTEEFKKMGKTYVPPKLVLFSSSVQSACGGATSATGPFYCSGDQSVYIDLSFFSQMKQQLGADGDFAYAYVIAHEVGHHVQYLLGILNQTNAMMQRVSKTEANQISVRVELQADFFAGFWAYHDNQRFRSIEDGDIEEGLNVASKIGDDYLQKQAQGYAVPETFNHGTSAQRMRWLKKGLQYGNFNDCDTYSINYSEL